MLDDGQKDGTPHGSQDEESREAHVVLEKVGEVVVVKEDEEEGDDGDEDHEHQSVEERALELLCSGVGGALEVDKVGCGADRGCGGGGGERVGGREGVDQKHHQQHAD